MIYLYFFFGPPHSPSTELLTKLKWYDGTTEPYYYSSRKPREEEQSQIQTKIQVKSKNDIMQYCNIVIENVERLIKTGVNIRKSL